jgi:hypothetical protein
VSKIRIHHTRNDGRFVRVPNATARDRALSLAARGYLLDMLSNRDDWEPETLPQAAARARRERPGTGESLRQIRPMLAELEARGYRHLVRRRDGQRFATEIHYYDQPARPCWDALTCDSCRRAGITAGGSE